MPEYPFLITLDVTHYHWKVQVYEPTIDENENIRTLLNAETPDIAKLQETFAGLLHSWNCTDRKGQPLPPTLESVRQLPQSVFLKIVTGLSEAIIRGFSDPKVNNSPLPITELKPGEPAQTTT